MALVTSIGFPSGNGGQQRLFLLKEFLKTVGWTVTSSGDGLSLFSGSGDVISNGGSGAGGLQNTRAWFAIRSPDGVNAFTFQTVTATSSNYSRVKWSPGGTFTGGNATTTPAVSGGVEAILRGAGTDASPTSSNPIVGQTTFTGGKLVMAATNTAPYTFWMVSLRYVGDRTYSGGSILFDSVTSTLPGDAHPYVWANGAAATGFNLVAITNPTATFTDSFQGFWTPGPTPTTLIGGRAAYYGSVFFESATIGGVRSTPYQDLLTGKDILFPIIWSASTTSGPASPWKGISESCFFSGARYGGAAYDIGRQPGSTASVNSTRDFIHLPPFAYRWDGSNPTALISA